MTQPQTVWDGGPFIDGTAVGLRLRMAELSVEVILFDDYGTDVRLVEGREEACFDAYETFCAFLGERRIIKYRLLNWAQEQDAERFHRPTARVLSMERAEDTLVFEVDVSGQRFQVVIDPGLDPRWPGDVGPSTEPALAWAGLEACYARMDQERGALQQLGFDPTPLDPMPGDPAIPNWSQ